MTVDVKVWGLDRLGKPFVQQARTMDATSLGARLTGITAVKVGEVIGVQLGDKKARFKVVWVGRDNTPKAGQIGVHCLEPSKILFAERGGLRTASADSGIREFRIEEPAVSLAPKKNVAGSRRKHPRYPCSGGVELRQHESAPPIWANLSDVSLTGCYVETISTLPTGTVLLFHLRTQGTHIKGRAVVKTSDHAVGLGLGFVHLGDEDQRNLEFLLGLLAGGQEMQPEEKRTFVPADIPNTPTPSGPMPMAADWPAAVPLIPTELHDNPTISARIMRAITELSELEQDLVKEKVDPRLIAQFHDAMEHTRQTAWTVQQWVDLGNGGNDPFGVLPQLEAERIHMLIKLARNVTADIDCSGINEFSEGVSELYDAVQQIHKKLAKLFMEGPEDDDGDSRTYRGRR